MNIYELLIVQPIFNLLTLIYSVMPWGDFGLALVIFTILMRFALYPLVRKQLHQTKVMRKLQPKLKQIKKNAKGNRQLEAMQMMELYKRHGVSPFRSIGILLIQLPIYIGLYHVIQVFVLHRDQIGKFTYDFLESLGPIKALIDNPDSFNHTMFGFIDLTKHAISGSGIDIVLVVVAALAGVTQYIVSKQVMPHQESNKTFKQIMAEAAEGKQADQAEMNAIVMRNMIKIMPVMMFLVMLNLPGALALYATVSSAVAALQQRHLLAQDEEELEELAEEAIEHDKKYAAKAATSRAKNAKEAHITRIKASDTKSPAKKRRK